MDLDQLLVSRLQFAFTIIWHIIFLAFTIGLSAYIATLCVVWMRTGKEHYRELARFWTKIFAVAFAMGVVSGIVLSYEFGTNWSRYSAILGNVVGPMIGFEVEVAFFLEATFLGVLLFCWDRMPPWLHTLKAIAVAFGTLLSAFWILSANSWMQTPAGYDLRDGVAYPLDWLAIVFNPSFPYRLAHMVTAAYLTATFVVLAVGARYLLAGTHVEHGRIMIRMAVGCSSADARRCRSSPPSPSSVGLLISDFPDIVPPSLTIWQAAASPPTHIFFLMGTLVMLPIIFGYTIFVFWIFGGKLREGEGLSLRSAINLRRTERRPDARLTRRKGMHRISADARYCRCRGAHPLNHRNFSAAASARANRIPAVSDFATERKTQCFRDVMS